MPFDARALTPLVSASPFTLWYYSTADARAAVLAPGYFAAAADRLLPGHMLILQASDAMAFLPVRSGAAVGNGLVLDTLLAPLRFTRAAAVRFGVGVTARAIPRAVDLDPLPALVSPGATLVARATAIGPLQELRFSLLNGAGAVLSGPIAAPVANGRAQASFTLPTTGSGYRIRVVDSADAAVNETSTPFSVAPNASLVTESGGALQTESGSPLLL
ncbi:hypothetical protein [Roseomonas sp. BN140053]|uniref:hypothetical protein n=1 Tax=Roseomonas sp. BN140053 TaxID=3391898 RepID=UPI0039E8C024